MTHALTRLDPASRALLDLSLRQGMRSEDIAEVLGADVNAIVEMCEGALATVAAGIGLSGPGELDRTRSLVAELPRDAWPGVPTNGAAAANGGAAQPPHAHTADVGDLNGVPTKSGDGAAGHPEADAPVGPSAGEAERFPAEEAFQREAEAAGNEAAVEDAAAAEPGAGEPAPGAATAAGEAPRAPGPEAPATEAGAEAAPGLGAVAAERWAVEDGRGAATVRPGQTRRRRRAAVLLLVLIAIAAAVAGLTAPGSTHRRVQVPAAAVPHTPAPTSAPATGGTTLRPLPGTPATAHALASLTGGRRLTFVVSGLHPAGGGQYTLWLFNSVVDAVPITRFVTTDARIDTTLPADPGRYRLLDLSFQPPGDGAPSGISVLRIPLAQLEHQR